MNWIKRVLHISEKIKKVLKKRPTKEEIESSDWTSCCKGPILNKELEKNLFDRRTGDFKVLIRTLRSFGF